MDELWYMSLGLYVCLSVCVLFSISQPTSTLEASCNKLYTIYVRWSFLAPAGLLMARKRTLNNFQGQKLKVMVNMDLDSSV